MKKLVILAAIVLAACGCKVIDTPKDYVKMDYPYPYLFRAVSPNSCAFTVRECTNEGNSELATWKEMAKNQLIRGKGYQLVSEGSLETSKGSPGWEMVFATNQAGLDYLYYVAVTRWEPNLWGMTLNPWGIHKLYVIEAAGEKGYIEKDLEVIKGTARSLRY